VSKFKMLFMKSCTVAVIIYLSCPFLIKTGKEIRFLYERLIGFLLAVIQGNEIIVVVCSVVICLLGFCLIVWILRDSEEKERIEETKEEA